MKTWLCFQKYSAAVLISELQCWQQWVSVLLDSRRAHGADWWEKVGYFVILFEAQSRAKHFLSVAAPVCWKQDLRVWLTPLLLTGQGESPELSPLLTALEQLKRAWLLRNLRRPLATQTVLWLRAEKMPYCERVRDTAKAWDRFSPLDSSSREKLQVHLLFRMELHWHFLCWPSQSKKLYLLLLPALRP